MYDEEKTKKINESPNIDAYSLNNNINKITLKDYSLPNHQCIGCTSILYKGWKLPSLNTLETPLMILDEKNCGEKDIQNSICAGLNSKFGATILVGCTLESDENG